MPCRDGIGSGVVSPKALPLAASCWRSCARSWPPLARRAWNRTPSAGAVDVDIASEQVAAEAKLDALVKRGKLTDAHRAAHATLRRTIQYGESLRRYLETAQRDIRAVDWSRDIDAVQREALDHIEERIHAEHTIRQNVVAIVENAAEETSRLQAVALETSSTSACDGTRPCRRPCSASARPSAPSRSGRPSSPRPSTPTSTCSANFSPRHCLFRWSRLDRCWRASTQG